MLTALLLAGACRPLTLDPPTARAVVVYDPSAGTVPTPNDLLYDPTSGRLALPIDDDQPAAERALRGMLNTTDGWSTTSTVRFTLSEPVDPAGVTPTTVQVWEQGATPTRVEGAEITVADDGMMVSITPPREGWPRGGTFGVVVGGGEDGLHTLTGAPFFADAAMTLLAADVPLDAPDHLDAFPGETRAERAAAAATLERVRQDIAPWIDASGWPRSEVAAAFSFHTTRAVELEMDRESQRVPLPFDVLRDAETGRVELTPATWDTPLEAEAKAVANTLHGFGLSADPFFGFDAGIDPATVTAETVQLWDVTSTPVRVDVGLEVFRDAGTRGCKRPPYEADCRHVFLRLPADRIPLDANHVYAIVVTDGVRAADGGVVAPMSLGRLLVLEDPVAVEGRSVLATLDDTSAARVESARTSLKPLLDQLGRPNVIAAWPFTTLDPSPGLWDAAHRTESLGLTIEPSVLWVKDAGPGLGDEAIDILFPGALNPAPPFYAGRTAGIRHVVSGTIPLPNWLDPVTRRENADYAIERVNFWAAVPEGYSPRRALPVVVFGHAVVTDRRFLITVAGELVQRGYVVVGIDFPYHGQRAACVPSSLVAVPNFFPEGLQPIVGFEEDLIWFPPCVSGDAATCSPTGECLDARGRVEDFSSFPVIDLQPVSGAAFLDTADIPHIPDHFRQALADLSGLMHSLRTADWEGALDQRIDPTQVHYVGQSLGSIIGMSWVASRDDIDRAVFNVPGSNLVDLFRESTYFQPQIAQLFVDLDIPAGSYEQERLFQVATWLVDTVDPHGVAHQFAEAAFPGLIQMDKVDANTGDIIIPNFTTENLSRLSGLETEIYPSALHADLIVPLLGDAMLRDAGAWLGSVPR
ncbi:MAG: hypothetical protein RLZZ383_686 [Pseudomonadota bacterium]|jgi:hypothetical protein